MNGFILLLLLITPLHCHCLDAIKDGRRFHSKCVHERLPGILVRFISNVTLNTTNIPLIENDKYSLETSLSPYYLMHNKTIRELPNCFTARRYGFDCDKALNINTSKNATLTWLPPLPSLSKTQENPDEYMRLELLRINSAQKCILSTVNYLGKFVWHPSMCHFTNRTFLSARGPERLFYEVPHFHWLDYVNGTISISGPIQIDTMGFPWVGIEQVRLIKINENLVHMSFCVPSPPLFARMQTAKLYFNQTRGIFELTKPVFMHRVGDNPRVIQKNWTPFLYNDSDIYFVYSVYPLSVIKLKNDYDIVSPAGEITELETVSIERCDGIEQPWEYGHLRGGSSAKLVNGEYMAFFHSKSSPLGTGNGWALPSYWMGVFTFSSSPPFRMTKISRFPIIKNEWYDGAWFNKANGYIIYPAGFVIEKDEYANVTYVLLSFSLQDKEGYVARINYDSLIESLMPVNCSASC